MKKLNQKFDVNEEMLRTFIGPKADYYLKARTKTFWKWDWHWPMFLFPIPWLAYRKQYWLFLLFLILTLAPLPFLGSMGYFVIVFVSATHARYFYYIRAYETIGKINLKTSDRAERERLYQKKGGINKPLMIIVTTLLVLLICLEAHYQWTHRSTAPDITNQASS